MTGSAVFSTMSYECQIVAKFLIRMMKLNENDAQHVVAIRRIIERNGGV